MSQMNNTTWHTELGIFAGIKPILVLEGNVLDSYRYPGSESLPEGSIISLEQYLHHFFKDKGYGNIVFYDSIRGFRNDYEEGQLAAFADRTSLPLEGDHIPACFKGVGEESATNALHTALTQKQVPTAVVMNYASRYIVTPDSMTQAEVDSFNALQQLGLIGTEVENEKGRRLKNVLVLVVNKANDVPAWFYMKNPGVKTVTVTAPTQAEREAFIRSGNFCAFFAPDIYQAEMPYYEEHPEELAKLRDRFVALTDEFCFTELNMLLRLSRQERFHIRELCHVVDLYRYGVKENPWNAIDRAKVRAGRDLLSARVKGQPTAIEKVLGIIKRSISGLGATSTRPRGVLFFAGPTGTGKTETAKAMAELIFGSDASIIRFDMAEYKQPHSDQKLLGAPPGYIGYEAGGQLTNAVKKKPFSILLFDEIEKADGSILDKFLQILDDGRLTDGKGETVYFSESVIIFTSNLGIMEVGADGRSHMTVGAGEPYEQVERKVKTSVENYFKFTLGRPELFNRIGADNVVVFDFIRPPVDEAILQMQIDNLVKAYKTEKNIDITIERAVFDTLLAAYRAKSELGGRGIRNLVEARLRTPLDTHLFDEDAEENATVIVHGVCGDDVPTLDCTIVKHP